jgi:hypothetical protein
MADHKEKVALQKWIVENLNREQAALLAAHVGVDYDGLAGGSEGAKAVHLIGYLERRARLGELFEAVERVRADPSFLGEVSSGLPERCPACSAPLRPDEIRWYNPSVAQCTYCGTTVKAGNL